MVRLGTFAYAMSASSLVFSASRALRSAATRDARSLFAAAIGASRKRVFEEYQLLHLVFFKHALAFALRIVRQPLFQLQLQLMQCLRSRRGAARHVLVPDVSAAHEQAFAGAIRCLGHIRRLGVHTR